MISEAILIPKIYARLQEIASNFSKFTGGGPQTPAGARVFGARFGASSPYRASFPKFLDPPVMSADNRKNILITMQYNYNYI